MALTPRKLQRLARRVGAFACVGVLASGAAPFTAAGAPSHADAVAGLSPAADAAPIDGFRQARFGMGEPETRRAIVQDFPAAAGRLTRTVNPNEKTTVLAVAVDDLLPDAGPARVSYILGYSTKRLIQVNIVWSSDGRSPARDEGVVSAANILRNHLQAEHAGPPDEVIANRQLAENAILVFRAAQPDGRMVLLVLSGVGAAARADGGSAPPLTLQLSYIADYKHPDVFRIERGRF